MMIKCICNILNLLDTEVERSPNLELYTCVSNTLNLHDTEVERSPNLKLIHLKCITYKCIKFKIRTAFYIDQCHED
jgi:hypothetical protein